MDGLLTAAKGPRVLQPGAPAIGRASCLLLLRVRQRLEDSRLGRCRSAPRLFTARASVRLLAFANVPFPAAATWVSRALRSARAPRRETASTFTKESLDEAFRQRNFRGRRDRHGRRHGGVGER